MRVKAICIKEYKDEDSVQDFKDGLINENDLIVYKVGDTGVVIKDYFDEKYWRII